MRFIDEARITVKAGDGGPGIVAWRREKFVPMGGPAGGNGGRGGDVIFVAREGMNSLLDLKQQSLLKAPDGQKGRSSNKTGRAGHDKIVYVPLGTIIEDESGFRKRAVDLIKDQDSYKVCRGGDGGFGNSHFKDALCNAPEKATAGGRGEERTLKLTLKLMADVGLLGFPSVGKSTLLAHMSNARPKVADYHFTTLTPMVGVCEVNIGATMVIADIPGLIEGASEGLGLGFQFLRHLERVRILCHLTDGSDAKTLKERYLAINKELENYSQELAMIPQLVAINKLDAFNSEEEVYIKDFEDFLTNQGIKSIRISAVSGHGLSRLKDLLYAKASGAQSLDDEALPKKASFDPTANLY